MRGFEGAAMRRRLVGGGPSVRTRISSVESDMSEGFKGDALPDVRALEVGEGYRLAISNRGEGGEGD